MHIELIRAMLHQQIAYHKAHGDMLDHVLLYGPDGVGQQQLADMLIREMDVEQETYLALPDHQPSDFLTRLVEVPDGGVLLIDNLHRLSPLLIPILEVVMAVVPEDLTPDVDEGSHTNSIGLNLPRFTVIGTTSNLKRVPPTIQGLFSVQFRVDQS